MNAIAPIRLDRGLPMYAHPLDPPSPYRLASELGRAVARDALSLDMAQSILTNKATRAAPGCPNLRAYICRLTWTLRDTANQHALGRHRATTQLRWTVKPLFQRRVPSAVIMAQAELTSGHILRRHELIEVCSAVAFEVLSGQAQGGRRG